MERATVDDLTTKPRLKTDEVPIDGVGSVLVRGLTRHEMIEVFKLEDNRQLQDNLAVYFGTLDPKMTQDQVMAWRKTGSNQEIEDIARKINELSGVGKDAAKSNLLGDGQQSGA